MRRTKWICWILAACLLLAVPAAAEDAVVSEEIEAAVAEEEVFLGAEALQDADTGYVTDGGRAVSPAVDDEDDWEDGEEDDEDDWDDDEDWEDGEEDDEDDWDDDEDWDDEDEDWDDEDEDEDGEEDDDGGEQLFVIDDDGVLRDYNGKESEVTVPVGVTKIGDWAFYSCPELIRVDLPSTVTAIGDYAFSECENLESINFPVRLKSIGDYAFNKCSGLKQVAIPANVTSIGYAAFMQCKGVTRVSLPRSLKSLDRDAFRECSSLKEIVFSEGIEEILDSAFNKCTSLTEVELPDSLRDLDQHVFWDCSALKKITIHGDTTVGYEALKGCPKVTIYGEIGSPAFDYAREYDIPFVALHPLSLEDAKVTVKKKTCTWTGKAIKPKVTVKLDDETLVPDRDYTVAYKNNKATGKATVIVTGMGIYGGTAKGTFIIRPKKVSGLALKAKGNTITVSWKKASSVSGYEIEYGLKKNLAGAKTVTVSKASKVKKAIKKLKAKKTYYVRIRAYRTAKTVKGGRIYSAWSKTEKIKTK